MKFDTIEPTPAILPENGVKYRLHALVWHSQTPTALSSENYDTSGNRVSPELMSKRLENYIKQILEWCEENYPGVVYAVDVVNGSGLLQAKTRVVQDFLAITALLPKHWSMQTNMLRRYEAVLQ